MHMISRYVGFAALACLPLVFLASATGQEKPSAPPANVKIVKVKIEDAPLSKVESADKKVEQADKYAKEGVIFEKIATVYTYQADGTGDRTLTVKMRVQSDNGVHEAGLLDFTYASGEQKFKTGYVRVLKPDGTVVETPADDAQDMPTQVTREAPLYSDLREVQIPVKSLSPGDELEYQVRFIQTKPSAPNQFWGATNFVTTDVVLDESLELSFPKDKYALVLSPKNPPVITEENGQKVYRWKASQLEPTADLKPPKADADALPAVTWTTFHDWREIGEWYAGLAKDRSAVTPEIQAKADELVKGKTTDEEKVEAIYNYVSTQVRYIGVDFGVGRYQPHSAETVLDNQYGDCKDKHTLLAALLKAAGYDAWPALIGTTATLHEEIPAPSQFDHVITVVSLPSGLIWLDSTPEVTPYRMLMPQIRDKMALVIPTNGEPSLMRSPANGPFPFVDTFTATGKLDAEGTLNGHLTLEMRGDAEAIYRIIFHSLPRSQWQQVAQNISERLGFAGTVSNLDVSLPEKTDKPFVYSYDYNRKDYADWSNRRILPLSIAVTLNDLGDDPLTKPFKLGSPRVETHHSVIELPPNYTAVLPKTVKYTTPFAVYEADYKLDGEKLLTDRRLEILKNEIAVNRADDYKKFAKNVEDDEGQFIQLVSATATATADTTPSNPDAVQLMQTAGANLTNRNYVDARANLQQAEQLNPREAGLWGEFSYLDMMENHLDTAIDDLRKEVTYHPENTMAWQQIVTLQMRLKRNDDAITTLHEMLAVVPDNVDAETRLAYLLNLEKKYAESSALLEAAVKTHPDNKNLKVLAGHAEVLAGHAELLAGKRDAGIANLHAAMDGSTDPEMLNDAAYELADGDADLPAAEAAAKKALDALDKETDAISLGNLARSDIAHINLLTATWDTMGWIYFREGKLPQAEDYVQAAWNVTQSGEVGSHLGQIYEKEDKLKDAAQIDALALAAGTLSPDPSGTEAVQARSDKLAVRGYSSHDASSEGLGKLRSYSLPKIVNDDGSADFFVLLSPGKVEDVQFIHGDERLKPAGDALKKIDFAGEFPKDSNARLVRRGILFCSNVLKDCQFTLLLPQSVSLQ
jgi:transglutaminase-like putative cysteine protease/tetratricopeptide (TPR) repeat protein